MNATAHIDADELLDEVARYLAAVETFRAEGCEPSWRREAADPTVTVERFLSERRDHRVVH